MLSTYIWAVDHKEGWLLATWPLVAASLWCFLWTTQWAIESEVKILLVQPSWLVLNIDGDLSLLRAPGWGQDLCNYSHTTRVGKAEGQPMLGLGFVEGKRYVTSSQEKVLAVHLLELPWKM